MPEQGKELYEFGQFRLDVADHSLVRSDTNERVQLPEKAFETLCILVRNAGRLVKKNELLNQVWADSFVEENNLNKCIHAVRRALGENNGGQQFIETIKKHGFRFVAEVRRVKSEKAADAFNQKSGLNSKNLSAEFPRLPEQNDSKTAVASPAHLGLEINGNGNTEQVLLAASTPAELAAQQTEPPVRAESNSESNRLAKYRLPLAAIGLAVFLTAGMFGFYFYRSKSAAGGAKRSIAVLPVKPINTSNRNEIYEVGIAESLILKLNSMKGFFARPLSATRKYADIEQDPLVAGREQQVDYVLASNYQLAGGKIKVTSQLFNVANGQVDGTYQSEQDAADVFVMQDAIAADVGNKLLARFATTSSGPMAKLGTTDEEAYRLYLQGRNLISNRTAAGTRKAVEYFEQAIQRDPNFARAYSGMAHALIASGNLGGGLPRVEYEHAKEVVLKALELDNNLAEGYAVLGELKFTYYWDFAGAEKDLLRAVELEPNGDLAHERYAFYLAVRGRFEEAIAESKKAQEINPNSLQHQQVHGVILYLAQRYDEAILQFRRVIEVDENHPTAYAWLRLVYEMKGEDAQAYEWFMKSQKRMNSEHIELFHKAYETSGWQAVMQEFFALNKVNDQKALANHYGTARQCALMGEKEQAFAYLNKAIEKHQGQMIMLNVEPAFAILRTDPRFDEFVKRVGLK